MNVGIYIYENAEVLDFAGPFEVFATASRFSVPENFFNVFLVAETKSPLNARAGFSLNPHYDFNSHPPIDVLIVVGGVHSQQLEKRSVLEWVASRAASAKITASVCTGAFILAAANVLTNQRVTTHWDDIEELKSAFPNLNVIESQRWVDEGSIVTSAGISAGIDMSLYLVAKLVDKSLAIQTARTMEFEWSQAC
ncbi:DJ-1/PfpI family protein [Aliikangiella marina]|uniref:DJ-1/PfpI family protein n=1 Tax=Aliikangiella marina TaxID=1712262 RepID=A0A545THW5_9GAMM|nr:DJ-1/PfpI family protein [Aliikangiella marina]TQV76751.1 DJ-1/PfpI family protein [Aliikangiella marina]